MSLTELCRAWNLSPLLSTWTPDSGTIHQTLLLKTVSGESYALRTYRYDATQRWRIVCEHALIAYACAHGLPAMVPLPLSTGETIFEHAGRFYALFPFATGHQSPRGQLSTDEIAAMGRFLGELHCVLHGYPHDQVPQRSFTIDHAATLARMDEVEAAIRLCSPLADRESLTLARLAQRRAWLMANRAPDAADFLGLEQQVIHGDYQETNLFFANGRVSAIIDWDQSYVAPRAWEIVRTLHYTLKLEPVSCRIFLAAYRRILSVEQEDLDAVAAAYGWMRAHDLWQYEELFIRGNQRLWAFMQPDGRFVPFVEQWAVLQEALHEH